MVSSRYEEDLGARVIAAGGAHEFLTNEIRDSKSLRRAPSLLALCEAHSAEAAARTGTSLKTDASLRDAAAASLTEAQDRLDEIRDRATNALFEHEERKRKVQALLDSFQELASARQEYLAVSRCREIANAHLRALYPLTSHQRGGSTTDMHTIASHVETLIEKVEGVRKEGSKFFFGDDTDANQRLVKSLENRAVDAVVKSRAAFVNVLDNEFRKFGWPMKIPTFDSDSELIESVNFYMRQLSKLQKVASEGDFVPARTKWHKALSDSWAIAAILRAPLARFKYHFLEAISPNAKTGGANQFVSGTSRFDRPEWAAEFALERVMEATPLLKKITIEGPLSADAKFAEGFCRVFADKVAYDCELALRASVNDADADVLIAHASETAKQFDAKLRSGVLKLGKQVARDLNSPLFMSSLHILSLRESFLATWASSELRLAEKEVSKLLDEALLLPAMEENGNVPSSFSGQETISREQLQYTCREIVNHIGQASEKARALESLERISTFLKLTELPLLQVVRSRLKQAVELNEYDALTAENVERCGRASFCAQLIAEALEDRCLDPLYVSQEERLGYEFYGEDISRLRALHSSSCSFLSDAISDSFIEAARAEYVDRTRFGEVFAPDAAVVLTHDLSEQLVNPLTALESRLSAILRGIPCRKSASGIWRPVARALDDFFFDGIVLQCFVGGSRNAMAAASEQNQFLEPESSAKMARQVAFDASTFVSTFSVVTNNPARFLPYTAECGDILRIAATKVLTPSIASRQEDEEVLEALKSVAESDKDDVLKNAKEVLETRTGVVHIRPREALELLAIGGLRFAIRLM